MKTKILILAGFALLSTCNLPLSTLHAQGALTPPGAPAPTMKTADQIYAKLEPRIPVSTNTTPGDASDTFIINQPGSYYLTTNIVGISGQTGIKIITNNVTLDLEGFALQGVAASGDGIFIASARTNITVCNGIITRWDGNGIESQSVNSLNLVFERLNVSANLDNGISTAGAAVIRECNCRNNGESGIVCNFFNNIPESLGGIITGCTADNNGDVGIELYSGKASDCQADFNGFNGIYTIFGTVSDCEINNNAYSGILVDTADLGGPTGGSIIGNFCMGNNSSLSTSDAGIIIFGEDYRIENNHVTASGNAGILVSSFSFAKNNVIIKNSVSGNGANNYVVPANNDLGPVGTAATATSPWANISH